MASITQLLARLLPSSSGETPVNPRQPLPSPQLAWSGSSVRQASHLPRWGLAFFLNLGDGIKDSSLCHYLLPLFNNECDYSQNLKGRPKLFISVNVS